VHHARDGSITSVYANGRATRQLGHTLWRCRYEGRFEGGSRSGRGKLTVHESDGGWIVMQVPHARVVAQIAYVAYIH
jgi:hypothetical protein